MFIYKKIYNFFFTVRDARMLERDRTKKIRLPGQSRSKLLDTETLNENRSYTGNSVLHTAKCVHDQKEKKKKDVTRAARLTTPQVTV